MNKKLIFPFLAAGLMAGSTALAGEVDLKTVAIWKKECASCHGQDGKGQTRTGKKLRVKDLTDAKHQESFTDEKAVKSIKEGMKDGNRELMKPFDEKLTDEEIKELVKFLRKFSEKK